MGVFKRMLTERDDENEFLCENKRLQDRIDELKDRMQEILYMDWQQLMHAEWNNPTDIQNWEIDTVVPEKLICVEDIRNAIKAAQEKLCSLWQEYYGVSDDEEYEGQISLFDICNLYTGELIAA